MLRKKLTELLKFIKMFHRLKIRLQYFWNVICLGKAPTKADIFITETYNQETTTTILHRDWLEVACLWDKSAKWEGFILANRPKVKYARYLDVKAGWRRIYYERRESN